MDKMMRCRIGFHSWREYIGRIAGRGELRWIKKCQLCKKAREV